MKARHWDTRPLTTGLVDGDPAIPMLMPIDIACLRRIAMCDDCVAPLPQGAGACETRLLRRYDRKSGSRWRPEHHDHGALAVAHGRLGTKAERQNFRYHPTEWELTMWGLMETTLQVVKARSRRLRRSGAGRHPGGIINEVENAALYDTIHVGTTNVEARPFLAVK